MAIKRLSIDQLAHILELGHVDAGGPLFESANKRQPDGGRLTLVIGIGGSGLATLCKAKQEADRTVHPQYRSFTRFLAIDLDPVDLRRAERLGIDCLDMSAPGTSYGNHAPFYDSFFPGQGHFHPETEMTRLTARVCFYSGRGGITNDERLRGYIRNLFMSAWAGHINFPVDIVIIAGLGGHAGGGLFLDVAAQARKACHPWHDIRVLGYLMLPDTAAERFGVGMEARTYMYANGFAALKELESYMSIDMEADRRELFPTPSGADDVVVSETERLFDCPVLISGDYDEATSRIARILVNAISFTGGQFDQRLICNHIMTARNTVMGQLRMPGRIYWDADGCPEDSHMYGQVGFAEASVPEQVVISNLIGRVLRKMYTNPEPHSPGKKDYGIMDRRLTRAEFENAMRMLLDLPAREEVSAHSLSGCILRKLSTVAEVGENTFPITYDDLVQGNTGDYIRAFQVQRIANGAAEQMVKWMQEKGASFEARAHRVMQEYGPRAVEYLYWGSGSEDTPGMPGAFGEISLRCQMGVMEGDLHGIAGRPVDYPGPITETGLFTRLVRSMREREVGFWKDVARESAQRDVYRLTLQQLVGGNSITRVELVDRVNRFLEECRRFTAVLTAMEDYYSDAGKVLDDANGRPFFTVGEPALVNACDDEQSREWLRDRIRAKADSIDTAHAGRILIDDFFEEREAWLSEEPGKARKRFDDVMSRVCGLGRYSAAPDGFRLTLRDYFDEIANTVPWNTQTQVIYDKIDRIMHRLYHSSEPAHVEQLIHNNLVRTIILLPGDLAAAPYGWAVQQAVQNCLQPGDLLGVSQGLDDIVCCRVSGGNGLCNLQELPYWEHVYDARATDSTHRSAGSRARLHMEFGFSQYKELTKSETDRELGLPASGGLSEGEEKIFGTGLSWRHYPSVNFFHPGNEFISRENTMENQYRREVFIPKIELALALKIIECERTGDIYKYYLNCIPAGWQELDVRYYDEQGRDGRLMRGKPLFDYLKRCNDDFGWPCRVQIALQNSPAFGPDGFDFSAVRELTGWSDEQIERTHRTYMMRIMRKATGLYQILEDTLYRYYGIEQALREREKVLADGKKAEDFVRYILAGVIVPDEDGHDLTVTPGPYCAAIKLLGRRVDRIQNSSPFQKKLLQDELILGAAYEQYLHMLDQGSLKEEDLEAVHEPLWDTLRDEEIENRMRFLEKEWGAFNEKFGGPGNPVEAVMREYELDDEELPVAERLAALYQEAEKVLREWR